ncbi:uncharacterized protein LOC120999281, partial [Bufo bufo]|uniref:uncharacterized protein LOC120999281 n=1 Tax=Bufo bufo TaxID=8384 RepID=UPI001ABE2A3A
NTNKSQGPDGIHPKLLKELSGELAKPLTDLFNQSLATGVVPEDWKLAKVVPIHKKGSREESGNYRPVSLTSIVGKLMETILKERIVEHLKSHGLKDEKQHGFTSGRSCQTNLIDFFDWVTKTKDGGGAVDIASLDFSKAFDTVPHRRLINKLQSLGLDSHIVEWIRQWLRDRQQRVVVNGVYSDQGRVTSGVPQGSVLGPILFNIFISKIAEGLDGKVCLFADDTKICNRVDVPGGIHQMEKDLGKLEEWSKIWQLKLNVDKCKIRHLGRKNPRAEYKISDTVLTSVSEERDLGVIISEDLKVGRQCHRAAGNASRILGCIGRGITSRKRKVLMPLYRALARLESIEARSAVLPVSSLEVAVASTSAAADIRSVQSVPNVTPSHFVPINIRKDILEDHARGRRDRHHRPSSRVLKASVTNHLETAHALIRNSLSPNTTRAYNTGWKTFCRFRGECPQGDSSFPEYILAFIGYCHSVRRLSHGTVRSYLAGVQHFLSVSHPELASVFTIHAVKAALKGLSKCGPQSQVRRQAVTGPLFRKLSDALDGNPFGVLASLVLKSAIYLAFYGFLRPGEFTCSPGSSKFLTVSQLVQNSDGFILLLKTSKTSQMGPPVPRLNIIIKVIPVYLKTSESAKFIYNLDYILDFGSII